MFGKRIDEEIDAYNWNKKDGDRNKERGRKRVLQQFQ